MSRKPPPEGPRWTIPDWSPDASAHEQEVMQYLDQVEMLRRQLAQERESNQAASDAVRRELEDEKNLLQSKLDEVSTELSARKQQNSDQMVEIGTQYGELLNQLRDKDMEIYHLKNELARKKKIHAWEVVVFLVASISVLHSIYAIGSWAWSVMFG